MVPYALLRKRREKRRKCFFNLLSQLCNEDISYDFKRKEHPIRGQRNSSLRKHNELPTRIPLCLQSTHDLPPLHKRRNTFLQSTRMGHFFRREPSRLKKSQRDRSMSSLCLGRL